MYEEMQAAEFKSECLKITEWVKKNKKNTNSKKKPKLD
jgi:hypothetical protein